VRDLVLPAFEMDCRDWLVSAPADVGLPDEVAGAPLLAVLSSVTVTDSEFREASGMLTMGLLDEEIPLTRPVGEGCVAGEILDAAAPSTSRQYVLPAPGGQLALLAEFQLPDGTDSELAERVEMLMASFRWAG
jgi:hypothetical protein